MVDTTGAAVPAVRLRLAHNDSGLARAAESASDGGFRFAGLAAGEYKLRVDKDGFASVEIAAFPVSIGQTVVQRIELRPAQLVERLEVREQTDALETAATTAGVALGGERIEETPAGNRNYLNFVLVAPGVAPSAGSNAQRAAAGVRGARVDSGFSFAGLRGSNNSLSIDGVDNRDETTGGNRVAIGLEMVREFRVSGASVGAESGGAAGGSVNVVTRSGTNLWHGDATFFAQNDRFNARDPEAAVAGRPRFRRHQPGASVLGPARKDRTFFATAIEQEWGSSEEWSEVPAGVEHQVRRAIPGATPVGRGLFPAGSSDTTFSLKADHNANARHSFSARYAFSRGRVSNEVHDLDNFADRSARGSSLTRDHSMVGGWTWVPGPRLVGEFRFQAARRSVALTPNESGPLYAVPGVLSFGQSPRLNADRTEDHYQVVPAINRSAGRHQLSFGANLHSVYLAARMAHRFGGVYVFPTLEDLELRRPDVFLQAFGEPATTFSTRPVGAWLQDRWQARPGLTIEAGFRYDRQWLPGGVAASNRNLAPRLGIAWNPRGRSKYVFRAGTGLFYDRYPLAFLNEAIQKDGRHGFEQYLTGPAATRALSLGPGTLPLPGEPVSAYRTTDPFATTYSRKLTLGLERSLSKSTTLSMEYSLVRGFHLPRVRNQRGLLPPSYLLEQTARSAYRGASVSLHRRMSNELAFLVAYNSGRTLDDASDFDEHPLDPLYLRKDWAHSRQHQPHRLAVSALFQLPVEAAPAWLKGALEDVVIATIFTAGRGRPINALDTTDTFRTGAWPISARPTGLARNPFYSPSTLSLDARVMKGFWLRERRAILQIGAEAFNLTNHFNPLRVSPYYAARGVRLASYGQAVETLNARQVQFLIQLEY